MAQSGYTPILLYGSNTASSVPSASNLTSSTSGVELALNYTDGKLYYKDNSGVVQLLASKAAAAGVLSFSAGSTGLTPSTATSGAVTLAGTLGISNGGTGITSFGTGVQTALGVNVGTAGSFLVNGGVLGTPSSGTVTNLTGTASININGTVGATTPSTGVFTTLTDTGLTSGRMTYAGTGGLLQDSANFTFNGTAATLNGQLNLTNASDYNLYASGAGANYMAGKLGIGQSYGLNKLTVAGYTAGANGAYATYQGAITLNDGGITTVNANGGFEFKSSVFGSGYGSKIVSFDDGSLAFAVRSNSATWSEYARINTSGTISLGASPGSESLRVTPVASAVNYINAYGGAAGNSVVLDAEGSDTNINFQISAKGSGTTYFNTPTTGRWSFYSGNYANEQFRVATTASAVNYLQVTGSATGNGCIFSAQGADANIAISYSAKGTNGHAFFTGGTSYNTQFNIAHTASTVNYLQVTGGTTGNAPLLTAQGSDTNIPITLQTKGTGNYYIYGGGAYFYNNSSAPQFAVASTASAVNYLQVTGGIAGLPVTLSAQGSDSNIQINYVSKGTGNQVFIAGTNTQFAVATTASAVNYLNVTGAATGSAPSIFSGGSDANVDIALYPQGTGLVRFGTYTAGIIAQAGSITIKDAAGNTRRLLVG